jgi:hypothetical protein
MSEKNSLVFYQDMKYRWGREEEYTVCCTAPGSKKLDSLVESRGFEIKRN